jgi:hypothetical protein
MEPIDRLEHIQKERWELSCSLCRQRMGAKLQCASCYTAFHPLCARLSGLTLEVQEPAAPGGQLRLVAYCAKHCVPKPGSAGGCDQGQLFWMLASVVAGKGKMLWHLRKLLPQDALFDRCTAADVMCINHTYCRCMYACHGSLLPVSWALRPAYCCHCRCQPGSRRDAAQPWQGRCQRGGGGGGSSRAHQQPAATPATHTAVELPALAATALRPATAAGRGVCARSCL